MRVRELWRFAVKSMGGERIDAAALGERGLDGDRRWAIRDETKGTLTSAKRLPSLLLLTARTVRDPDVEITFPDGSTVASNDPDVHARLSAFLGTPVTLQALRPASDKAFYRTAPATADDMRESFAIAPGDPLPDFSMLPIGKLLELGKYATPPGTFFDAFPIHVVTTASLGSFDVRRFRANIVVDAGPDARGYLEATWTGGTLAVGDATLFLDCPTPRCSMPTRAQAGALPADKSVLATLVRDADRCLGIYATPTHPGQARVGDPVTFAPPASSKLGDWAKQRATGLKRMLIRAAMPK